MRNNVKKTHITTSQKGVYTISGSVKQWKRYAMFPILLCLFTVIEIVVAGSIVVYVLNLISPVNHIGGLR